MDTFSELVIDNEGKILIPQEILTKLGINKGDKLELKVEDEAILLRKATKEDKSKPPLHLLYRPEITIDLVSGEALKRELDFEARLMTIPFFAKLAKRSFFIMGEKNRHLAFNVKSIDDGIAYYLANGKITREDLRKAGIEWPR